MLRKVMRETKRVVESQRQIKTDETKELSRKGELVLMKPERKA